MPVLEMDEARIFFEERVNGKAGACLVFIHGAGGDHSYWRRQMEDLPPGIRGIAVDLPGHGESKEAPRQNISEYADLLCRFIAELKTREPVILVGHSMGAAVTLEAGLRAGETLAGLVLVGGGARMKVNPGLLATLAEGKMDLGFLRLAFGAGADRELVSEVLAGSSLVSPSVFFADFTACDRFDVRERLDSLKLPVLLVVGQEDRLTPLPLSRLVTDRVSGAKMVEIAGAGHFVMLEKPAQVNRSLYGFVQEITAES